MVSVGWKASIPGQIVMGWSESRDDSFDVVYVVAINELFVEIELQHRFGHFSEEKL